MEEVHLFPDRSEEIAKAILAISNQMNCNPNLIHACFGRLDMFWSVPEHLSTVADTTHHLNRVSRFAEQLFNAMNSMSSSQQESLIAAGAVTSFQIQHLAALLEQDSASLDHFSKTKNRKGGRNHASYDTAELMRRLFRRLRRKITYGADQFGNPSTQFGKAVEFALGAFCIKASWRGPTSAAVDFQHLVETRRGLCAERKFRAENPLPQP